MSKLTKTQKIAGSILVLSCLGFLVMIGVNQNLSRKTEVAKVQIADNRHQNQTQQEVVMENKEDPGKPYRLAKKEVTQIFTNVYSGKLKTKSDAKSFAKDNKKHLTTQQMNFLFNQISDQGEDGNGKPFVKSLKNIDVGFEPANVSGDVLKMLVKVTYLNKDDETVSTLYAVQYSPKDKKIYSFTVIGYDKPDDARKDSDNGE